MGILGKLFGIVTKDDIGKIFIHPECKTKTTKIRLESIDDKNASYGPIRYKVLNDTYWIKHLSIENTFNTTNNRRFKEIKT